MSEPHFDLNYWRSFVTNYRDGDCLVITHEEVEWLLGQIKDALKPVTCPSCKVSQNTLNYATIRPGETFASGQLNGTEHTFGEYLCRLCCKRFVREAEDGQPGVGQRVNGEKPERTDRQETKHMSGRKKGKGGKKDMGKGGKC